MSAGKRVGRRTTGEVGIVLSGPSDAGFYEVQFLGGPEWVREQDLNDLNEADVGPLSLLKAGRFGVSEEHDLYVRAKVLQHAFQYDSRSGLSNARIEPKLWQLFVMLRVLNKTSPRMILADEVGLGKTVEAGLIIKELKARKLADRVLVITPASLVEQWRHELESKFNESFDIFDAAAVEAIGRGRRNAWSERDNIVCSLPFARGHADEILETHWDLVVIDEAHKVARRWNGKSWDAKKTYDFAVDLRSATQGLLLLTATPMQVHPSQLFSLIELVDPGVIGSLSQYLAQIDQLPRLNELMRDVQAALSSDEACQEEMLSRHAETLAQIGVGREVLLPLLGDPAGVEEALTLISSRHFLADVMVRNRKREVMDGLTNRHPHVHLVDATDEERSLYEEITEYIRLSYNTAINKKDRAVGFLMVAFQKMLTSSSAAIAASFENRAARLEAMLDGSVPLPERRLQADDEDDDEGVEETDEDAELSEIMDSLLGAVASDSGDRGFRAELAAEAMELRSFAERLRALCDSKAEALVLAVKKLLNDAPHEKLLVFTQFIETQRYLADLLEAEGIHAECFNGSMRLDEKEESVRRFRGSSPVMVSTESGGEGRNFQFCHVMVNFDLPWNPMKVEQRIGRIDRIGQTKDIEIHNLAVKGTLEERVLQVLAERIHLFERSVGSLDPILGQIEKDFEQLAMADVGSEASRELEVNIEERKRQARLQADLSEDLAMDRSSFRRDEANKWLEARPLAEWTDLMAFVEDALRYYGGRISRNSSGATVIAISPALRSDIQVKQAKYEGEFDPKLALADDPDDFFAMGHEVVDGLVRLASANDVRQCAALSEESLAAPEIEVWYELINRAGRPTGQLIRHRVGASLDVRSAPVSDFPRRRRQARDTQLPEWVERAVEASLSYLQSHDTAIFENEAVESLDTYRQQELARLHRLNAHSEERFEIEVGLLESMIADYERSGTEKQRRMLPARRGKLAKVRERAAASTAEYRMSVERLEQLRPDVGTRVLAIALVVPA